MDDSSKTSLSVIVPVFNEEHLVEESLRRLLVLPESDLVERVQVVVVDDCSTDGTGEVRLTDNGYSQGLADWSHSGKEIVYTVSAIGNEGKYDIYLMNADGTNNRNITPDYFPAEFLCHAATFSANDSSVYFIGEWWEQG